MANQRSESRQVSACTHASDRATRLCRLQKALEYLRDSGIEQSHLHIVRGAIEDAETQQKLIEKTVEKFGQLDVLVNNAATSHRNHNRLRNEQINENILGSDLDADSLENLSYITDSNLKRRVIGGRLFARPDLAEQNSPAICILASIQKHFQRDRAYAPRRPAPR